ncbi:MAG: bifunctional fructose-bisphosphatase/inositol-phosphate phosphatase [Methanobacteriaceae archaeon]|nr:bifunctional fructose-bisphosphatase/inositol-phosphate phosphatase [Methanobacteriaceae archaeon]
MMNQKETDYWLNILYKICDKTQEAVKNARDDPHINEIIKIGADGTPTHKIDDIAEKAAISVLESSNESLILISEEIGEIKIGNDDPKIVIILDPLDGTTNALKKIPCYGISIAVAKIEDKYNVEDLTLNDINIGFVKNFPTGDIYHAIKGNGSFKNGKSMNLSKIKKLEEATVGAYIYRAKLEQIDELCKIVRRMRILGSIAVELCYVADGTYDSFIDGRNIVRILDIAAAQLIITETGGIVTDKSSCKLKSNLKLSEKTSIVASANEHVHDEIVKLIN